MNSSSNFYLERFCIHRCTFPHSQNYFAQMFRDRIGFLKCDTYWISLHRFHLGLKPNQLSSIDTAKLMGHVLHHAVWWQSWGPLKVKGYLFPYIGCTALISVPESWLGLCPQCVLVQASSSGEESVLHKTLQLARRTVVKRIHPDGLLYINMSWHTI